MCRVSSPNVRRVDGLAALLEAELRRAMEKQEQIHGTTVKFEAARQNASGFTRVEVARIRALKVEQLQLAGFMDEIRRKLMEEEAEVYRYVVESVIEEMTDSALGLGRDETGDSTQNVQMEAIRKLKDLIEAFKARRKEAEAGKWIVCPAPPQGEPPRPPLVPDLVQLELIKKQQEALRLKTQVLGRRLDPGADDVSPAERAFLRRLSDEQGRLHGILGRLIEKFNRQIHDSSEDER